MDFCVITDKGCEEYAALELKEKYGFTDSSLKTMNSAVFFSAPPELAVRIAYTSQSIKRMILNPVSFEFSDLNGLQACLREEINPEKFSGEITSDSFKVECERKGTHDFNSVEAEKVFGDRLKGVSGKKIDLKSPGASLYVLIDENNCIAGFDVAGRDLSKRQHRVFNHASDVKGSIAFSFLLFSEYTSGEILVDPFALSGVIPIEAAIYSSGFPINFYSKKFNFSSYNSFKDVDVEKVFKEAGSPATPPLSKPLILSMDSAFKNVSAQKKNARIAGVEKHISFSRTDTDWLDIKLKERKADRIACKPPEPSKRFPESKAVKHYESLFRRSKPILSRKGSISFIARNPFLLEEEALKQGFRLKQKKVAWQGEQELFFVKFTF